MKSYFFYIFILINLFLSSLSKATIIDYQSFEDVVLKSDFIVGGKIKNIESSLVSDKDRRVFTVLTISHASLINGDGEEFQSQDILIRYQGGRIDVYQDEVKVMSRFSGIAGMPEFINGEEVVLFIRGNGELGVPFVGMSQGVLRISDSNEVCDHANERIASIEGGHFKFNSSLGPITKPERAAYIHRNSNLEKPTLISHDLKKHAVVG